jgi:hypothetical protein
MHLPYYAFQIGQMVDYRPSKRISRRVARMKSYKDCRTKAVRLSRMKHA